MRPSPLCRAEQQVAKARGVAQFSGFLDTDDSWQGDFLAGKRGSDSKYFAGS